jgi:hypothetical protein
MSGKVIHLTATIRIPAELAARIDALAERLSTPTARASRSGVAAFLLSRAVELASAELAEKERPKPPREWRVGDECEVLFDMDGDPEWRVGVVCDRAKSDAFAGRYRVADTQGTGIKWSTWAHPSEMRERGR